MTQQVYISDTNIWIDFRNAGLLDAMFSLPFTLTRPARSGNSR